MLEAFNLQVVSSTSWGAQRLEELIYHAEVRTLYSAGNGEVEFYEVVVPEEMEGKKITDLQVPSESLIVAITRAGRAMMPEAGILLHKGDILSISATLEGIEALRERINVQKGA